MTRRQLEAMVAPVRSTGTMTSPEAIADGSAEAQPGLDLADPEQVVQVADIRVHELDASRFQAGRLSSDPGR